MSAETSTGDEPGSSHRSIPENEPVVADSATLNSGDVQGESADADWVALSNTELTKRVEILKRKTVAGGQNNVSSDRNGLVAGVLDNTKSDDHLAHKKGAFTGVFVPTCENMWGVLIFLRFYWIVGYAGVGQALLAVFLSFLAAFCTVCSMSAIVSSGGHVSEGGPYYMISRAMGPVIGCTVGVMYWLAVTMLSVLECLGAVEGILMAAPEAEFDFCTQIYGSALMLMLALMVYGGIKFVTRLGLFFVLIVFLTLLSYYVGLATAPYTDEAKDIDCITGISWDTLKDNIPSHYSTEVTFGSTLAVFYPCFTGILSGANRADVLRDPPRDIRVGTFGAIFVSLIMYSSFMILWGSVADYHYLQGDENHDCSNNATASQRRLAGGADGAYLVDTVVFNPVPHTAHVGIIISSLSQALQCLVVAPRLLQSIAKDKILSILTKLAPLSSEGEPVRALWVTYVVAALLVLIGNLNMVAPLLTMCFLVAYAFMNISCFSLTWLRSPAWRPTGIHRKRYRVWYLGTGLFGFAVCITIMFIVDPIWAAAAILLVASLYAYINYKLETREWGSAMDGIRFQLALKSLIGLEGSQNQHVNWRPQVLILYRVRIADELQGKEHHEILQFYSNFRKADGFCVVACVLEAPVATEEILQKAALEKDVIRTIMAQEGLQGFAEVAVAPSWVEGSNYIIQLSGIGGLVPNCVLLDWPDGWERNTHLASDFVKLVSTSLAKDKSVLAVKGLSKMPSQSVFGTIDIWWMIHDGGFMILLSWLLVSHRMWRNCKLRVFTITETVEQEHAEAAAAALTKTLRQKRLADVNVEVILADAELITPFTFDWTIRAEERLRFLEELGKSSKKSHVDVIPDAIDDLFKRDRLDSKDYHDSTEKLEKDRQRIQVTDARNESHDESDEPVRMASGHLSRVASKGNVRLGDEEMHEAKGRTTICQAELQQKTAVEMKGVAAKLNRIMVSRSKLAQLVIVNLPDLWGTKKDDVEGYMSYTNTLTNDFDRVLFVHSSGHEIFDIHT